MARAHCALGAPQVSCAILSLGGKTLTIRANGVDGRPVQDFTATPYVEKATLNGAALERNYVTRAELQAGGELVFTMSPFPNRSRGTGPDAAPYSLSAPRGRVR